MDPRVAPSPFPPPRRTASGSRRRLVIGRRQYQIRIRLADAAAETARHDPSAREIAPLAEILRRHGAALVCQHDAFAAYVAEAERRGPGAFPLYAWTRATIGRPRQEGEVRQGVHTPGGRRGGLFRGDGRRVGGGPPPPGRRAGGDRDDTARYDPANNPQVPKRYPLVSSAVAGRSRHSRFIRRMSPRSRSERLVDGQQECAHTGASE